MILAIDAGGTSTRAVVLDDAGHALGFGSAGGGNPTSSGVERAVDAITEATRVALGGQVSDGDVLGHAAIAMAGEQTAAFQDAVRERLRRFGFGSVDLTGDLLGMFHSGTFEPHGHVLVAGTGAVAARIDGSRIAQIAGGNGWLVGDEGSGFHIGQQVARAVVADLDGIGVPTAMTPIVLDALGVVHDDSIEVGRTRMLRRTVSALYGLTPIGLARFAPIAFRSTGDPVARAIVADAARSVAALLAAVRAPDDVGPLVIGGSVLVQGFHGSPAALSEPLASLFAADTGAGVGVRSSSIRVEDGLVGAAVIALRGAGLHVGATEFTGLTTEIAALRSR